MSKEQLKALMAEDVDAIFDEVVQAMNRARPGHIIDDSEAFVREAAGEFRRRLFEKALKLRSQREASSPSADREEPGDAVAQ
jgi:hypothetical protein